MDYKYGGSRKRARSNVARRSRPRSVAKGGYTYGKGVSGYSNFGGAKKAYSLKRYSGRPKISKSMLDQLYGDNLAISTYLDRVKTTNTTGTAANQAMWANRVSYDAAISGATQTYLAPYFNLLVHDPLFLNRYTQQTSTAGFNNSAKTSKLFVKNYTVSACLTNLENGPIEIWEYRLIARTRITLSGWNTIMQTLNDPTGPLNSATGGNALSPGAFTAPVVTVTFPFATTTSTQLGINPYMIPGFTRYFKISSVKKKLLNPADRWCITYSCKRPMIYDNEKFNLATVGDLSGSSTNPTLWAGMGFSMFIMKGTFALDDAGATAQKIGIGNAAVGIEYNIKAHYALIAQNFMSSHLIRDAPGFTIDEAGYPAPILRNLNINAISTGPTPAAAGSNVYGPSGITVPDDPMDDED